jgi:uncharacterized protein involved in type VI secretion and phage assembly
VSMLDILSDYLDRDEARSRVYGVLVGIVTQVDAENARVKLRFPVLSEEDISDWARIAVPMAGDQAGHYHMPEAGDEALCAFEHGDIRFPYVVGFLWGAKKPPANQKEKRTIKSRSGHIIEIDDTQGTGAITIKTAGGQEIKLLDTPGSPQMTISATGTGTLQIQCLTATIQASGSLTVNAPTTTFNGVVTAQVIQAQVVQTQVIQATTVVGTTYTPGVGNLI